MRNLILIFIMAVFATACQNNARQDAPMTVPLQVATAEGVSVPVYEFDGLKPMFDISDDTLRIFNFWATWCVPCVKEIPYFEKVNSEYTSQKVKVILISLDFIEDIETGLIPFIKKHELTSEVVLLDDPNANRWIPMVEKSWDGAIPVTLFKKGDKRSFVPHTMEYDELVKEINNILKTDK